MEVVIKNKRLRDYLYALGFNYRKVKDTTNKQDFVYLFLNTEDLSESIEFYIMMKKRNFRVDLKDNKTI